MTTPTTGAAELPEALRLAASLELCWGDSRLDKAAAELRRLHAENEALRAQPVEAATPAAPGVPSDAMVDAYLQAQRRAIEEADQFGRPNIGGLHTNTVREACRSGLKAALAAAPQPPAAEQSGGKNAQLATNSDPIAPGQQRSMAGPLAMGQRVGDGQHEAGRHTQAQGNKLLTVAERNLRRFLETAVFRDEADRQAALNCLEVLSDKRPSPQPAVTAETVDALVIAEAALADIGDADREPGDDVAWCEARAAQALPMVRAALAAQREVKP